jgi:hypothetical protein
MPLIPPRQAAADVLLWIDTDTKFLLQRGQDAPVLPAPTRTLLEAAARGEEIDPQQFEQALEAARELRQKLSLAYLRSPATNEKGLGDNSADESEPHSDGFPPP